MFNTGTVVGVSANIFGGDFPPKSFLLLVGAAQGGCALLNLKNRSSCGQNDGEKRTNASGSPDIKILKTVFDRDAKK